MQRSTTNKIHILPAKTTSFFVKKVIKTNRAPKPIGPYNQAILAGDTLYVSGQIALVPETNEMKKSNVAEETRQVMENLKQLLEVSHMTFENVVKSSVFVSSMDYFEQINKVYGEYFLKEKAPARETVEVSALPKNANVEISIIAVK